MRAHELDARLLNLMSLSLEDEEVSIRPGSLAGAREVLLMCSGDGLSLGVTTCGTVEATWFEGRDTAVSIRFFEDCLSVVYAFGQVRGHMSLTSPDDLLRRSLCS